jgi:hypothetical protein
MDEHLVNQMKSIMKVTIEEQNLTDIASEIGLQQKKSKFSTK